VKRDLEIAKFSACGEPKRTKSSNNINYNFVIKKIPHPAKSKKKHWLGFSEIYQDFMKEITGLPILYLWFSENRGSAKFHQPPPPPSPRR